MLLAVGMAALAVVASSLFVALRYQGRIHSRESAPAAPVALVFGAGLSAANEPSPVLAERLDAAVALYRAGKVKKLLVSGDNSDRWHDETGVMRRYAEKKGVPPEAMEGDAAGLSTYDSCLRARDEFGVRQALLVTQDFHLPRALFIANSLGIDAHGVRADAGNGVSWAYEWRELFGRALALVMVVVEPPPRVRGRLP